MQPDSCKHLEDVRQAAELIIEFTVGLTVEDYLANDLVRAGVERQFEIIGEALKRLLSSDPETTDDISDTRKIIAFRNILIHGYHMIDHRIVWDAVENKLPVLRKEVCGLLGIREAGDE